MTKKITLLVLLLCAISAGAESLSDLKPANKHTLWYTRPATQQDVRDVWMEYSLPIGNGQLGASLFGGVERDQILFNEKTLWSGGIGTHGDYTHFGDKVIYGSYMLFGNLYAECLDKSLTEASVKNYVRTLNLDNALGTVHFTSADGQARYSREYFVSYPDRVVVAHYSADKKGMLSLRFTMESGKPGVSAETTYKGGCGRFNGKLNTVSYAAEFRVIPSGGTMQTTAEGITIKGADEVMVVLAAQTDYDAYSPTYTSHTSKLVANTSATARAASAKKFEKLKATHTQDFTKFMGRVSFDLGGENTLPTDELVNAYNNPGCRMQEAECLEELYFHYGRYLEISSSRGVDLPNNLQGIWNNSSTPAWHCDIHANINVQMNYWPAEAGNLSEMHECYTNYIWNQATNHAEWQQNARQYAGQTKGWTMFTENNIFGGGSVFQTNYVIGNAWHCTHLWQHYRYTLDRDFLKKKALPTMWSCCEFWLERLKLASDGTYECPDEFSPEHGPRSQNATAHAQQLVADLFANTLEAIETIGEKESGISAKDIALLRDRYEKLDKGLAIETYDGSWGEDAIPKGAPLLREWKYASLTEGENHHRHASHLMCLYPFSQITPASGELFTAAINSMKQRGDASTGWSMGWKINLWARALDGDRAHSVLRTALQHSTSNDISYGTDKNKGGIYYNLYDSHPPFQIDGNFGACAGIMEMVLQSHTGTLQLLPALPSAWPNGHMKGLKAVGGYTVDQEWADGRLTKAAITAAHDGILSLQYPGIETYHITVNGKTEALQNEKAGSLSLQVKKGDVVVTERQIDAQEYLKTLFKDAACTQPQEMSDEDFTQKAAALPNTLRQMAMKVKTGQWAQLGTSGTNWDKAFRIAKYKVYSNHQAMADVVGTGYIFGRLSNPTGIRVGENGSISVMVGDEYDQIPRDKEGNLLAELSMELVQDDSLSMHAPSATVPLHKGLNSFYAPTGMHLFIYYEIKDAQDDESRFLERFPDVTIQIAGGEVQGYFDVTRPSIVSRAVAMTDADWRMMLRDGLFRGAQHVQLKHEHVMMNMSPDRLLAIEQNRTEILPLLNCYNNIVLWEEELMGIAPMWDMDDYFYHTARLGKRFRNLWNATSCAFDFGYQCATSYGTYYNNYALPQVADARKMNSDGVVSWGPAHEFGHCHQKLITMLGMTEVSNNLFSNVLSHRFGATMSRGDAMSTLPHFYAKGLHWIDYGIWAQTQLYWKLYQYFHLAGHQTDFYPRLFDELRKEPFPRKQHEPTSASNDYLHFARVCCRVANADLSDLFECYGFFRPLSFTDTIRGIPCRKVDDYGTYYLYATPEAIDSARAEMQSYKQKIPNLVFIDDRILPTLATYEGAPEGAVCKANEKGIGSQGDVGQWTTFAAANYHRARRGRATWSENADGTIDLQLTPQEGDVGYKVMDRTGRLVYFSSFRRFPLPAEITAANISDYRFLVADAKGRDAKLSLKKKAEERKQKTDLILRDIYNQPINDSTDYRIQFVVAPDYKLNPNQGPSLWRVLQRDGKVILRNGSTYVRINYDAEGKYAMSFVTAETEATAFTVVRGTTANTYILDDRGTFTQDVPSDIYTGYTEKNPQNAICLTPVHYLTVNVYDADGQRDTDARVSVNGSQPLAGTVPGFTPWQGFLTFTGEGINERTLFQLNDSKKKLPYHKFIKHLRQYEGNAASVNIFTNRR